MYNKMPRKVSPKRRVKRKTSPKRRVKRKTSPRRKLNPPTTFDTNRELMERLDEDRRAVREVNRIARERAGGYDMFSDKRLGDAKLVEILTYVNSCEDLMKMHQSSRGTRAVIMENLPYIYRRLQEKDKNLPVLVWTDSPEHNYMMFVNSCLDRERQKIIGDDIEGIFREFEEQTDILPAQEGYRVYKSFKERKDKLENTIFNKYQKARIVWKVTNGSWDECMIDTFKGFSELGFLYPDIVRIVKPRGCYTKEIFMFLGMLIERSPLFDKNSFAMWITEREPTRIISDYINGNIDKVRALRQLEIYMI